MDALDRAQAEEFQGEDFKLVRGNTTDWRIFDRYKYCLRALRLRVANFFFFTEPLTLHIFFLSFLLSILFFSIVTLIHIKTE